MLANANTATKPHAPATARLAVTPAPAGATRRAVDEIELCLLYPEQAEARRRAICEANVKREADGRTAFHEGLFGTATLPQDFEARRRMGSAIIHHILTVTGTRLHLHREGRVSIGSCCASWGECPHWLTWTLSTRQVNPQAHHMDASAWMFREVKALGLQLSVTKTDPPRLELVAA